MRRKLFVFAALPASFVLGVCAQIVWLSLPLWPSRYEPGSLRGTVSPGYELTGYYYGAHEFPLAFSNFERIDLFTADFRASADTVIKTPIEPKGYLLTNLNSYKLSGVDLGDGRFSFTTESRGGESYEFTGRVLGVGYYQVKGYSEYHTAYTIMIGGRLVRRLFGFKVAESDVRFTKGSGC